MIHCALCLLFSNCFPLSKQKENRKQPNSRCEFALAGQMAKLLQMRIHFFTLIEQQTHINENLVDAIYIYIKNTFELFYFSRIRE